MKLLIIGAGAWGTSLSLSFSQNHDLTLCARNDAEAQAIMSGANGPENPLLPGFIIPASIRIFGNLSLAIANQIYDLIIIATPVSGLRPTLTKLCEIAPNIPFLWACKGLEHGSALLTHQVVAESWDSSSKPPFGALSGPSFAEEVARKLPTAITIASDDLAFAEQISAQLNSSHLRIYAGNDLIGVELGGALKNVLAIATGICDGMGLGHNARAALITRGLVEMTRLGTQLGAQPKTFMGLSGLGDLILTATGDLSRNRRVGLALATGKPLNSILEELGHVAEGVLTTREVAALAERLGVEMPITVAVDNILHHGVDVHTTVRNLMSREAKAEFLSHM